VGVQLTKQLLSFLLTPSSYKLLYILWPWHIPNIGQCTI